MTIQSFIKKRPHLVWYVSDLGGLSEEAIVEATLNYGDWEDFQNMVKVLGLTKTAKIFREKSKPSKIGRQNYEPKVINYFTLYFNKYVR